MFILHIYISIAYLVELSGFIEVNLKMKKI